MRSRYKQEAKWMQILKPTGMILLHLFRLVFGAVFVFSGFVKAVDPYGLAYKIEDYLSAFGWSNPMFYHLAMPLAVLLPVLELLLGLMIFLQVNIRWAVVPGLIFMLLVTPLTWYIAVNNPVTDCGCFGDALVITNWQTFYKNIILLFAILILQIFRKKFRELFRPGASVILTILFATAGIVVAVYSVRHEPLIDFRPYKTGVNILHEMQIPDNAPKDEYNTTFIYQKDGLQKEFTLENYPANDSTWQFVDQKTTLVKKGFVPPIHDFAIVTENHDDLTYEVLQYEKYTYLLIMYQLDKASVEGAKAAEKIYQQYKNSSTRFYALTASTEEQIVSFRKANGITYPFAKTDPVTLKTMMRSNPGLILLKNGVIKGKWSWRDFE